MSEENFEIARAAIDDREAVDDVVREQRRVVGARRS
jgi:hypothetical protein